mmetsp:Transcript_18438/g.22579  ORF Transcript_18438/g.22579 Transcript_18438/m.22579 type:complete len:193 (+) Transcript_18438:396-974(+)
MEYGVVTLDSWKEIHMGIGRGFVSNLFLQIFADRTCQLFQNAMAKNEGDVVVFNGRDQERHIRTGGAVGGGDVDVDTTTATSTPNGKAVTTISFPVLLHQSNAPTFIHFISLDVEGQEYNSLLSFPFDTYKVGVWIIENGMGKVAQLLELHGYHRRMVKNRGVDEYFVKDEFWDDELLEKEWRIHPFASWGC